MGTLGRGCPRDGLASGQVLIFAEKKADVDAIHEYLLLKGVEAVAIHGGKGRCYIHSVDPAAVAAPLLTLCPARLAATPQTPTVTLTVPA